MKRIILLALCMMCVVGTVNAYMLTLKCPESIQVGLPLKCSIDSTFPAGKSFNLVLYQSGYTSTMISEQPVTLQEDHKTLYRIFDTIGLPGGTYKAEIQFTGADEPQLNSDSITTQLVTLLDRSGDIEITSPMSQDLADALRIEGSIKKGGAEGVEVEVRGPDGRIFGPQWIGTTNDVKNGAGIFTKKVAVTSAGSYDVDFKDAKGFIGRVTFTVVAPATQQTTVIPVTTAVVKTTKPATTVPTPWPTTAQSPVSLMTVLGAAGIAGLLVVRMHQMKKR